MLCAPAEYWCQPCSLSAQTKERQVFAGMPGDAGQACVRRRLGGKHTPHPPGSPKAVPHSVLPVHGAWCLFHVCHVLIFTLSHWCTLRTLLGHRSRNLDILEVRAEGLLAAGGGRVAPRCHMHSLVGGFWLVVSLELRGTYLWPQSSNEFCFLV